MLRMNFNKYSINEKSYILPPMAHAKVIPPSELFSIGSIYNFGTHICPSYVIKHHWNPTINLSNINEYHTQVSVILFD